MLAKFQYIQANKPSFGLAGSVPGLVLDNLVAHYTFDKGEGQVLPDLSGCQNHGTLGSNPGAESSDPTWIAGGLSFDGGDIVNCGDDDSVDFAAGSAFTLIAVAKNTTGTGTQNVITKGTGGVAFNYGMRYSGTTLEVHNSASAVNVGTITIGEPQFLGAVWTGSQMTGWINLNKSAPSNLANAGPLAQTLKLGSAGNNWLTGAMYYCLIYKRALSDTEMRQVYSYLKNILTKRGVYLL